MGIEWGLYHRPSKEWVNLGKWCPAFDEGDPPILERSYQLSRTRIQQFIASHPGKLEVFPDSADVPEDHEAGWVRVDSWDLDAPEPFVWDDDIAEWRSLVTGGLT